jgi:hypothetical protein
MTGVTRLATAVVQRCAGRLTADDLTHSRRLSLRDGRGFGDLSTFRLLAENTEYRKQTRRGALTAIHLLGGPRRLCGQPPRA